MADIKVKLKPFIVPNYALVEGVPRSRDEGWKEPEKYPLSVLSAETLDEMCAEFRRSVFEKAGIPEPPKE